MRDPPDPKPPAGAPLATLLRPASTVVLIYPLIVCAALYAQWLVAWLVLGHQPIPSTNDPKYIPVSEYLHWVTGILVLGIPFAAVGALGAFVLGIAELLVGRRPRSRTLLRLLGFGALWVAVFLFLRWDPGQVLYWWFD